MSDRAKISARVNMPRWPNYVRTTIPGTVGEVAVDVGALDADAVEALVVGFRAHCTLRAQTVAAGPQARPEPGSLPSKTWC